MKTKILYLLLAVILLPFVFGSATGTKNKKKTTVDEDKSAVGLFYLHLSASTYDFNDNNDILVYSNFYGKAPVLLFDVNGTDAGYSIALKLDPIEANDTQVTTKYTVQDFNTVGDGFRVVQVRDINDNPYGGPILAGDLYITPTAYTGLDDVKVYGFTVNEWQ